MLEAFSIAFLAVLLILLLYYLYYYIRNISNENEEQQRLLEERQKQLEKYEDFSRIDKGFPLKNRIPNICANKNIFLIDYENVGTIPKAISEDSESVVFVFIGNKQKESEHRKRQQIDTGNNFYYINMDKTMHNYLDIFMSCWIGAIISTYPPKSIRILSKDKGFTAVIEACKVLGFMDIDYLHLQIKAEFNKEFIIKNLKDMLLVSASRTIPMKKFKARLKRKYPQWTIDEVKLFISQAIEYKLIKVRKIEKQSFIDILI